MNHSLMLAKCPPLPEKKTYLLMFDIFVRPQARLCHTVGSPPPITIRLMSLVAEKKDFQEDLVLF